METQSKLYIQSLIKDKKLELNLKMPVMSLRLFMRDVNILYLLICAY